MKSASYQNQLIYIDRVNGQGVMVCLRVCVIEVSIAGVTGLKGVIC